MIDKELVKACPFCGDDPEIEDNGIDDPDWGGITNWWFVHCKKCDYVITDGEECTREKAIEKWNNRPSGKLLEWSIIPPNVEGWWWKLDNGVMEIVKVKRQRAYGDQLCCLHGADYGMVEKSINAQWAGPISIPQIES